MHNLTNPKSGKFWALLLLLLLFFRAFKAFGSFAQAVSSLIIPILVTLGYVFGVVGWLFWVLALAWWFFFGSASSLKPAPYSPDETAPIANGATQLG